MTQIRKSTKLFISFLKKYLGAVHKRRPQSGEREVCPLWTKGSRIVAVRTRGESHVWTTHYWKSWF